RNLTDPKRHPVPLAPGVTIGSDPSASILVDEPGVREIQASVMSSPGGTLTIGAVTGRPIEFPDGSSTWNVTLLPGATFVIGKTTFRCESAVPATSDPLAGYV